MRFLARALAPKATAFAHCDLPCGVYDPAQARIEAESVKAICEKYQQNSDHEYRERDQRFFPLAERAVGGGSVGVILEEIIGELLRVLADAGELLQVGRFVVAAHLRSVG